PAGQAAAGAVLPGVSQRRGSQRRAGPGIVRQPDGGRAKGSRPRRRPAGKSRLVLMVEGKLKPAMPPQKAKQPRSEELAVLRAWVAAGAKDDSNVVRATLPEIKP